MSQAIAYHRLFSETEHGKITTIDGTLGKLDYALIVIPANVISPACAEEQMRTCAIGSRDPFSRRPTERRYHHPSYEKLNSQGWRAVEAEETLSESGYRREVEWALSMGLPGADSLTDRKIPTFSRGENLILPALTPSSRHHSSRTYAMFRSTMLLWSASRSTVGPPIGRAPDLVRRAFGEISGLYTPYNYETGVDLREQMTLCDAGDVFTIPGNLEKSFDQISRGIAHIFSSGALPLILGGRSFDRFSDHSRRCSMHQQEDRDHPL